MTDEKTFRKTVAAATEVASAATATEPSTVDFAMLEPRDQLKTLLQAEMKDKPFSELASVTFDHRGPPSSDISCLIRWRKPAIPLMMSMPSVR